jgi:hypothetical protein
MAAVHLNFAKVQQDPKILVAVLFAAAGVPRYWAGTANAVLCF